MPRPCLTSAPCVASASAAPAAKKPRADDGQAEGNNAVLAALKGIQGSLTEMDARLQFLEENNGGSRSSATAAAAAATANIRAAAGPSGAQAPTAADTPIGPAFDTIPLRSLGTAVPAAAAGVPFYPPAAAVSPYLRGQILAGNDINLVKILLCSAELSGRRLVDCGEVSVVLKENDCRLTRNLTMPEFNVAFGVYRDIICEIYPQRRFEFDTYLAIISDLAMSYGGNLFYEYHKSFSAKAALYIQKFNQRLDWAVVDLALISRHFTGHHPLSCSLCGAFTHTVSLCPQTANQRPQFMRPVKIEESREKVNIAPNREVPLCINFNENVCRFANCKFIHACSYCGDGHPRSVCPRRTRFRKKK